MEGPQLISDGHKASRVLEGKIKLANDWAHVRRKFVKAAKIYLEESQWFIDKFRALSLIERSLKEKPLEQI